MQETGTGTKAGTLGHIEAFVYAGESESPAPPAWMGWGAAGMVESPPATREEPARNSAGQAVDTALRTEFDQRMAEEKRKAFEAGREKGRQEGCSMEREAQAANLSAANERHVQQAAKLIESFADEQNRYLQAVESEVVELALAVAARILRREAQMDPLLLTGAVRVALGQLSRSSQVRLRVPPAELGLWTEAVALLPNLAVKPTVLAGEGMRLGDCLIETEMGSVDLGIRAQLGEIERGFFDRAVGCKAEATEPVDDSGRETRG